MGITVANSEKKKSSVQSSKFFNPSCLFLIEVDFFSLYVLFSHFRPRDATRGNSFFQMSSYARANVRITNEESKRKIPTRASRGLKWEKMYKLKRSIGSLLSSRY